MKKWDIISSYINELNNELSISLNPRIQEAPYFRYPCYCNCVEKTIYIWSELFWILTEEQQKQHVIYAYSVLLAAEYFGKESIYKGHKSVQLSFNPEKVVKIVSKVMGIRFCGFEQLQSEIYETKQSLFPYPDIRGSYFKVGDVIKCSYTRFKIIDIYNENNVIMIKAQSINSFDKEQTVFCQPEREVINNYRLLEPVEFS